MDRSRLEQLVRNWREDAAYDAFPILERQTLTMCANELEAAMVGPVQITGDDVVLIGYKNEAGEDCTAFLTASRIGQLLAGESLLKDSQDNDELTVAYMAGREDGRPKGSLIRIPEDKRWVEGESERALWHAHGYNAALSDVISVNAPLFKMERASPPDAVQLEKRALSDVVREWADKHDIVGRDLMHAYQDAALSATPEPQRQAPGEIAPGWSLEKAPNGDMLLYSPEAPNDAVRVPGVSIQGKFLAALTEAKQQDADGWEANFRYLLDRSPHTLRSREGGGPENLMQSAILTFTRMEQRLEAKQQGNGTETPTLTDCSKALDAAVDVICECTGERRGHITDDLRFDHLYDAAKRIMDIGRTLTPQGEAKQQAPAAVSGDDDTRRLNWLATNPRGAQIVVNGEVKPCIFWGVSSAPDNTLREAIDLAMLAATPAASEGDKP